MFSSRMFFNVFGALLWTIRLLEPHQHVED
jgi:hypothetical protein